MDLQRKKFQTEVAGRILTLETSRLAEQANAAVMATYEGTTVLATVVMSKEDKDTDFMPLMVDFEEKNYAIGRILGSQYVRREGRPSTDAVLSGRIIDRAIRPLFNSRIRRDIQVTATVLSYDGENDLDFVALSAVSAALHISDIPWNGPIAGVSLAQLGSEVIFNPINSVLTSRVAEKSFSSFVAGLNGKVNMIELEGYEAQEANVIASYEKALFEIEKITKLINDIRAEIGKPKSIVIIKEQGEDLKKTINEYVADKLDSAVYVKDKTERENNLSSLLKGLKGFLTEKSFDEKSLKEADIIFDEAVNEIVHKNVIEKNRRPDGRALDEVRELYAEVGLLPRTHGSSVFVRGNTQSLAIATLGAPGSEKVVETIRCIDGKERFMLNYNFPGYSVGEAKSYRGPGRRDIGHGALAEKAVRSIIPSMEEFPYVIRVVSEILSSNGSSSMATVCSSSLALMDAGVPIKKPVAGIAMGLMSDESGKYKILTDIQGPEDHYGDMDFKVAGTNNGINAIQMDVKVEGVLPKVLLEGINQAKEARLKILSVIASALSAPRPEISKYAPKVEIFTIDPEKIGAVIGPGGKMINSIIAKTKVSIEIEDSGRVFVAGTDHNLVEQAINEIKTLVREFKVGEIVEGTVVRIMEFGAIVDIGGGKDGMVHVSEIKEGFVKNVTDVLNIGDFVKAKIIKVDPGKGKLSLSIKQLNSPTVESGEERRPREHGGFRGGHRDSGEHRGPKEGGEYRERKEQGDDKKNDSSFNNETSQPEEKKEKRGFFGRRKS